MPAREQRAPASVTPVGTGQSFTGSFSYDDASVPMLGFNGEDLHSQSANIDISGAGSATTWVDDTLNAQISGAGSITYYGKANVSKQVSGLGSVSHAGDK